jgi:hypothetical protein
MSDMSWLKDYGAFATAVTALVVAIISLGSTLISNKHKARLERIARREAQADDDLREDQKRDLEAIVEAVMSIQAMRDVIRKLLSAAGEEPSLLSEAICADFSIAARDIATAHKRLSGQHRQVSIKELHHVKLSAQSLSDRVHVMVKDSRFVPRLSEPNRSSLLRALPEMKEVQDLLRDQEYAIRFRSRGGS